MRLRDKVAIITGAGKGIGRAYALSFADEGAKVVICSRTPSELDKVAKEIEAKGREILAVRTDVSDEASVKELVKKTWDNTPSSQITISPEFTICRDCDRISPGFRRGEKKSESRLETEGVRLNGGDKIDGNEE